MSKQIIPFGGTVEVSADGSLFEPVPEAKGLPVPSTTQEFPEVTSLDSPGGYREFIAGLKDSGEVSFVAGYTSDGYDLLIDLAGINCFWRVTFPLAPDQASAGDVFTFRGFVTPSIEANDVGAPISLNIAVRTTGEPVFTKGS